MIGIVYIGDLKYCPYLSLYTEVLNGKKIEYEVLYWSREAQPSEKKNEIPFLMKSRLNEDIHVKAQNLYRFRKWLLKRINKKKYDKLIVLSTLSGMIIADLLITKYSNRFIFDIRDFSYENNNLFKFIEGKIIESSVFTGISSKGFLSFLPQSKKYIEVHNLNKDKRSPSIINKKMPINLVWLGSVRYFEHQKRIIEKLSNDFRFNVIYHGSGPELQIYKEFCSSIDAKNVFFTGEYDNNYKEHLLAGADIINNSYHSAKSMETRYAISNKFYDGVLFNKPQLVEDNTFKASIIEDYGIGISLDVNKESFADDLYNYFIQIDEKEFTKKTEELSKKYIDENRKYINEVINFLYIY